MRSRDVARQRAGKRLGLPAAALRRYNHMIVAWAIVRLVLARND
jgi:hypothetical protein